MEKQKPETDKTTLVNDAAADSSTSISMVKVGGTYVVPVRINETITLDFVVDSGASDVSIPADVVSTLLRTGTIDKSDFIGTQTYVLADGTKVPSVRFHLRSLRVGPKLVTNVVAGLAPAQGSLLLGQSFLGRFEAWSIDNARHELVLQDCCRSLPSTPTDANAPVAESYTPGRGSAERLAIMNAARSAQRTRVRFMVHYLAAFRRGASAIAVADLSDAAGQMPYGGMLFFEESGGHWRALYAMYMDGSESCAGTVDISSKIIAKAKDLGAPQSFLPLDFYEGYNRALSDLAKDGEQSDCATTARY